MPAAPYAASAITDDDWTMRTSALGVDMVEVTLTLGAAGRQRLRSQQLTLSAAAAALLLVLVPLPSACTALLAAAAAATAAALARAAPFPPPPLLAPLLPPPARLLALALELALRAAALALALALLPQPVVQESVIAMRGLGVQLRTVRQQRRGMCGLRAAGAGSGGGGGAPPSTCRFVDASSLKALVVNEGIQACDVRYYLALVTAGQARLLLLFDHARPRLPALSRAYRSLLPVLFPALTAAATERYLEGIAEGAALQAETH